VIIRNILISALLLLPHSHPTSARDSNEDRYPLRSGAAYARVLDRRPNPRAEPFDWIKPPALWPGDTIMFVAPAGPVQLAPLRAYAKRLQKAGYKVIIPNNIGRKSGYLAGTDEERAAELNAAIRDPKVRAIFPCRGGYGLTRILDRIDYAALRKDPKILIGFSDLTALHLAVARKARLITFHSPLLLHDLWREEPKFSFAASSFRRAIFADQYKPGETGYEIALPPGRPGPVTVVGGKTRGRLVGGNLTLICATLGTPYAIEPKGNILFIEDTNEAPYRVDRALSQLRLAGVLDAMSGIVAGHFNTKNPDEAKEMQRVLLEYLRKLKVPVIMNFPIGHIALNATVPHGAAAELDADRGSLRVLENPVRLNRPGR
jgi:muramoyltetrapeptide carboxypeptidase